MPPGGRRRSSSGGQCSPKKHPRPQPTTRCCPRKPRPPHYSASLPSASEGPRTSFEGGERWLSQEGYGTDPEFSTLESGQHMIVDLNITQTESVTPEQDVGGARVELERVGFSPNSVSDEAPSPNHTRSASDSVLLNTNSNSLPDLVGGEEQGDSSTSPENNEEGGMGPLPSLPGAGGYRHTRHLSLMGGQRSESSRKQGRKKKPKRASSIKQRSRSPPNLPPPPPPPERVHEPREEEVDGLSPSSDGLTRNPTSTTSLGFSQVMTTITNIDQQLDQMAEQYTSFKPDEALPKTATPPKTPPSATRANVASILFHHPKLGLSPAPESRGVSDEGSGFVEDEWLCDFPPSSSDHTPHTSVIRSPDHDVGPLPEMIADHRELTNGEAAESAKPTKVKHRVMFKDEVEDIPSYEPRVDNTPPLPAEELPVGVAAIKAKLFGSHEQEAMRYKKEGVLSPKHTHPMNATFSDDYFSRARQVSPNINNNNSASEDDSLISDPVMQMGVAGGMATDNEALVKDTLQLAGSGGTGREPPPPQAEEKKEEVPSELLPEDPAEPDQNLYDAPWEQKSISKYKVIGVRRRSGSSSPAQAKEKTPPPVAPKRLGPKIQIAEVSVEETPRPSNTAELRNVHSLERKRSNEEKAGPPKGRSSVSPSMGGVQSESSLLASISNTLQATSRYGSDSLLNNGDSSPSNAMTMQGGAPLIRHNSGEVKMSSRGELEKIRAAHRKEATPTRPSKLAQANAKQHSSPQLFSAASHAPKGSAGGVTGSQPQLYPSASANHAPHTSGGGSQPTTPVRSAKKPVGLGGGVGLGVARSQPQLYPHTVPTHSPAGGGVIRGIGLSMAKKPPPPRGGGLAASVEGLQRRPDTHVTYDAQTQAHIFRSLV